jgi:hypothetical protein
MAQLAGIETAGIAVRDMQVSVEKLRKDAAEAARIRALATDETKQDVFDRLQAHLNRLADEVEQAMKAVKAG